MSSHDQADESELVLAAQAGDREAFAELVCRHQASLRALVALNLHGRNDIHELVQESLIDAWRGLAGFDAQRELGPWLRTICRNRVRQYFRERQARRGRERALVDAALLAATPAEEDHLSETRLQALRDCLSEVPAEHRQLLTLRYTDELPVQEIASTLGKTPNGISMVLLRLKAALQRCITLRLERGLR